MNPQTSSYQPNRRASCSDVPSTPKTANNPSNNERLMQYLALLEAQESITFERMITPQKQKHKRHHRHNSFSKNATAITPTTNHSRGELDDSIHKLLKSRRKDLRKAVHLISPSKQPSKEQAVFATPIEDGKPTRAQQQQSPPSRRSTIIQAAVRTNAPKASAAAVAKLPRARLFTSQAPANDNAANDWTCGICQHGPSQSHHTMLARLPCGHVFHNTCSVLWLGQSCACPTCGYEMETNDATYEAGRRERIKHRAPATCFCPCSAATKVCLFANSPGVVAMPCSGSAPQQQPVEDDEDCSEASFEEDSEATL